MLRFNTRLLLELKIFLFPLAVASGGQPSSQPSSQPLANPSPPFWAQIASSLTRSINQSPLHNVQVLNKLKETTTEFVKIDSDILSRARSRFQHSLFGKFFGKPTNFEQVKLILLSKWPKSVKSISPIFPMYSF